MRSSGSGFENGYCKITIGQQTVETAATTIHRRLPNGGNGSNHDPPSVTKRWKRQHPRSTVGYQTADTAAPMIHRPSSNGGFGRPLRADAFDEQCGVGAARKLEGE